MTTPFGPQLIGETEKTLNALLQQLLAGTGLSEAQWVTLRLAGMISGDVDSQRLADEVTDRAHLRDAADLVDQLARRDLLNDGHLTNEGRALIAGVQARITEKTAPIWRDLPDADVDATTRVLNEVVTRSRALLA
jgi:hypothetical protein